MKTVFILENALEPTNWDTFETADIRELLRSRFSKMPETARIYHQEVAQVNDVTPVDELTIERLGDLPGPFYVIIYPADPFTAIVAVGAIIAAAAAAYMLQPSLPSSALRNTQSESPNNELSDRQNRPRPFGRIPDIYGTVRATPDLLSSYKVFKDHEEVEYSYMAISRGEGSVPAAEIRDGDTRVQDIAGTSVEIYGPFTSPNSGDAPQLRVGSAIDTRVFTATRSNAVNGQTLRPPNADGVTGDNSIRFRAPDRIEASGNADIDFSTYFIAGDSVQVSNASFQGTISGSGFDSAQTAYFEYLGMVHFPNGVPSAFSVGDTLTIYNSNFIVNNTAIDFNGTYIIAGISAGYITLQDPTQVNFNWVVLENAFEEGTTPNKSCRFVIPSGRVDLDLAGTYSVLALTSTSITLASPSSVNTDWALLANIGGVSEYLSPTLQTLADRWIGPFILEDADEVLINTVALNGFYRLTSRGGQRLINANIEVEATKIDAMDNPISAPQIWTRVFEGSATTRSTRALTIRMVLNASTRGRVRVRVRRATESPTESGTIVDEIKWRDLYAMKRVAQNDFGNITTVQSITYATAGALAVKDRKLNMIFTRRVPRWLGGTSFSAPEATNRADHILTAIALDPRIGNRRIQELDLEGIYATIAEAEEYFGTSKAIEFSYTFDNDNLSFEETMATLANAIFCVAYRQGSQIKLKLERATEDSVLLFNHRNKVPGSETRTISFGNQKGFDGVEYEWVDPEDDSLTTFYLPPDKSAINPKKIESIGVRNYEQAFLQAHRAWNKIQHQTTAVDFEATQEAELLTQMDRILVADNTRTGTQDGQIISQEGLTITLSQKVLFEEGETYTIFLQLADGTIESMPISPGPTIQTALLSRAPRLPLVMDPEYFAQTLYQIVKNSSDRPANAFLLTGRESQSRLTSSMSAINYSSLYYSADTSFKN